MGIVWKDKKRPAAGSRFRSAIRNGCGEWNGRVPPHFWPVLPEVGVFAAPFYAPTGSALVVSNCRSTYCKIPPLA
jgi:hypothetical protein